MRSLLLASAFFFTASADAQDFKPFPRADITQTQWQAYYDEVSTKHGANVQIVEKKN